MLDYRKIFENNRKWADNIRQKNPEFFKQLSKGQKPEYLYIGCSDSRVTAEQIMGAGPGEVFVHRNIANMVIATDINVMSVIRFAIKELNVRHIIVCGHYECGGVHAALQPRDMGSLNLWLRNIRDVYRLYEHELHSLPEKEILNRLVELNVLEQCNNVVKTAEFQTSYRKNNYPSIHGWVFDIHSGLLKDLNFDFEKSLKEIQKIYRISY